MEKQLIMENVINKQMLSIALILICSINAIGQSKNLLIQSNEFDLNLGAVSLKEIRVLNDDFHGLEPLGKPKDIHFEDRGSQLYYLYTYDKLKLHYVNMGEGPELIKMEVFEPNEKMTLDGVSIPSIGANRPKTLGRENKLIIEVNQNDYPKEYLKFGKSSEYVELFIEDGKVLKMVFKYDLQI